MRAVAVLLALGIHLPARSADVKGEFGSDLRLLSSFFTPARVPGESNYYIDMWESQNLQSIVSLNGLTNNHALFINCHGKRVGSGRFALYPHQSLVASGAEPPCYSVGDIAATMGFAHALDVHNLVLAACNAEGALSTKELRKFFPNATNIIHCEPGELGYQPMYLQAILNCSWTIKPIYEWRERNEKGQVQYVTGHVAVNGAKRLAPYTADIFVPGIEAPIRSQRAGRELLDPEQLRTMASRK